MIKISFTLYSPAPVSYLAHADKHQRY